MAIGESDIVNSVMLFIRGGGDDLLPAMHTVVAAVGGRGWDCSTGEFLDRSDAAKSLVRWQECRDRVIAHG